MVTKQLSLAIAVAISFSIGLGIARPHLETFAAAPAASTSLTKIDFDQVFADVTRQGAANVDRAHKGDRLPNVKSVARESVPLPYCEPVASPYSDPILGRIVGRCAA
jgi:hypothetical protein